MTYHSPATPFVSGFVPLLRLLKEIKPNTLEKAVLKVAQLDRTKLIVGFRSSFLSGKRILAFLFAERLIDLGIPPCFWHDRFSTDMFNVNQNFDLMVFDLRWLRHQHPDHVQAVNYKRTRTVFKGTESGFHSEAEFTFHDGKRPVWRIVKSLGLTDEQQFECASLQSVRIRNRCEATNDMRDKIFKILQAGNDATRRTNVFDDLQANKTLFRRHQLWLCRNLTDGTPTATAKRYYQMTGEMMSRQVAARQLEIVEETLRKSRLKVDEKSR